LYIARDYDKNSENWISWFFITRRQWTDAVELYHFHVTNQCQSICLKSEYNVKLEKLIDPNGVEDDVSARLTNLTSTSCDLDL